MFVTLVVSVQYQVRKEQIYDAVSWQQQMPADTS